MNYWLDVFTPKSWQEFLKAGASVSGFPDRRWTTVQRMQIGDVLLCYLKGRSCWFGALKVVSPPFRDENPRIWSDAPYPCRVQVQPAVILEPGRGIGAKTMLRELRLFADVRDPKRWSWPLRGSPRQLAKEDGDLLLNRLEAIQSESRTQGNQDATGGGPSQKRAAAFEMEIIRFLKNLDFKDVDGGVNFKIGGIQVDACGGHEDTLLVVECTTTRKKEPKYVRDKLKTIRGVVPMLNKGFHKEPRYQKYRSFKYVLATGDSEVKDVDKAFAEGSPRIHLWGKQFIEYYRGLYGVIGSAAKYNLLGEMGIEPRTRSIIQVPAWATSIGNSPVYSFFVEPRRLLEASYVARREIGNEKYYQRILQKKRIGKIRAFLKDGKSFPNSIIIAFEKSPHFTPYPEISKQYPWWPDWLGFGCLSFPANYRSCWIIDGQHRLYAFSDIHTDAKLSVIAFHKIPVAKQAAYFIEINREQKPVDPDLIWDLEGEMSPTSDRGMISNVVKELNRRGPLKGKIYVPLAGRKLRKQLKFSGICLAIQQRHLTWERTISMRGGQKNPLYSRNSEQTVQRVSKAIGAFYEVIDQVFTEEEKDEFMFTNVGATVMIELLEEVVSHKTGVPSSEEAREYLEALRLHLERDYHDSANRSQLRKLGSSEAGRREILVKFVNAVREITGEKSFASHIPSLDAFGERVIAFERKLATFIFTILDIDSEEDLSRYAPPNLCERVIARHKSSSKDGNADSSLCDYLTLGECKEMLQDKRNVETFRGVFVATESGFSKKEELDGALESLTSQRAAIMHGRPTSQKYKQQQLLNLYVDKLEKCMSEYQQSS